MRVSYPEGGVGTQAGGAQFKVPLPGSYETLTISYRVRFGEGFDFVKGGKLPGLCGGECNTGGDVPDGTDGFSARLMWRVDGSVMQYMYMPDQQSPWGDNLHWTVGGQRYRACMASGSDADRDEHTGQHDEVIQSWLDGDLALDRQDVRLRDVDTLARLILLLNLLGGSPDWAPSADEVVDFDDLIVSRRRFGSMKRPAGMCERRCVLGQLRRWLDHRTSAMRTKVAVLFSGCAL